MLDYLEGRIDWDTFLAGRLPNTYSGVTNSIEPIVTLERVVAWVKTLSLHELRPILDAALERAASLVDPSGPPSSTPPFSPQSRSPKRSTPPPTSFDLRLDLKNEDKFPDRFTLPTKAIANELLAIEEPTEEQGTAQGRLARLVVALGEKLGEPNEGVTI